MPNDEATTPPGDDDLPPALASSVFGSPAVDRSPPYLDARRGSLGDLVSVGEACAVGTRWEQWRRIYPCALSSFPNGLSSALQGKRVVLFSDYDGTLAPIVRDPDQAHMSEPMRRVREWPLAAAPWWLLGHSLVTTRPCVVHSAC